MLKYKNFKGSVEYEKDTDTYHGSVLDIKDLVLYEGETKEALYADFKAAVDDYIDMLEDINNK